MFLTDLVVKISFFICQENPWGKQFLSSRAFRLSTYLYFAKFEAFWHVFDLFGCQNLIFHLPVKPFRQINSFRQELSFEYLFVFCKIWGSLTCFWLIWLSKSHFSFARKILEANQILSSRAFVWVLICILQNLRHFDMFLTDLVVKMPFFICQKNPWGKSIPFVESFHLSTYL